MRGAVCVVNSTPSADNKFVGRGTDLHFNFEWFQVVPPRDIPADDEFVGRSRKPHRRHRSFRAPRSPTCASLLKVWSHLVSSIRLKWGTVCHLLCAVITTFAATALGSEFAVSLRPFNGFAFHTRHQQTGKISRMVGFHTARGNRSCFSPNFTRDTAGGIVNNHNPYPDLDCLQ